VSRLAEFVSEGVLADLRHLLISESQTIGEAIQSIDRNAKGIVLIVDSENRLLGTVTDGNIRRAILGGVSLQSCVKDLVGADWEYPDPIAAEIGLPSHEMLSLMREKGVRQLPLLDKERRVSDLVTLEDLVPETRTDLTAVVMAGGEGMRLRPLTEDLPKPMLPVGGRPVMEHIIDGLRDAGIRQVNVTTHYKPQAIVNHFGDGSDFGVQIGYVSEDEPLGTAGALGLMDVPDAPVLVINGDILTKTDFRAMLTFHEENQADLTIGVREFDFRVPFGVVETEGVRVSAVKEKPSLTFFANAGLYLLDPKVYEFIPDGKPMDMTDLIDVLLAEEKRVVSFPICEYWMDIGQHEDYEKAKSDADAEGPEPCTF
jgi:dTDP-glucose pyrophosphorylase